jgi:organic hydroperoxide reductase OsmC/OhrA
VALESEQIAPIRSASPAEFGGPGDQWSPETRLVAALADCFVLTFRAITGVSRFPWISLTCEVAGTAALVDSRSWNAHGAGRKRQSRSNTLRRELLIFRAPL